jgi:hypothetical protein
MQTVFNPQMGTYGFADLFRITTGTGDIISGFCFFFSLRFYVTTAFDFYYTFQLFPIGCICNKGKIIVQTTFATFYPTMSEIFFYPFLLWMAKTNRLPDVLFQNSLIAFHGQNIVGLFLYYFNSSCYVICINYQKYMSVSFL